MGRMKSLLRTDRVLANPDSVTLAQETSETRLLTMRRQSLGRRLYGLYRIYDSMVLEGLHAAGFTDIRPVHTDIVRAVDVTGSRLTDVATNCNITKQAASQLVKELVSLVYMSLVTVPHDTRVRMVVFTERGMGLIVELGEIFVKLDRRLAEAIGQDKLNGFRDDLEQLIRSLDRLS